MQPQGEKIFFAQFIGASCKCTPRQSKKFAGQGRMRVVNLAVSLCVVDGSD